MSDEQANEVIRLRHRLRAMALQGQQDLTVREILNRFCTLSETLGDAGLCMEAARWRTRFEQVTVARA